MNSYLEEQDSLILSEEEYVSKIGEIRLTK